MSAPQTVNVRAPQSAQGYARSVAFSLALRLIHPAAWPRPTGSRVLRTPLVPCRPAGCAPHQSL